jgi:hypothetical protein
MARLEYTTDSIDNREMNKIVFEFGDELTITEFKLICKRMAAAMGYSDTNIKSEFGDDVSPNFDEEYTQLIESIFKSNNY